MTLGGWNPPGDEAPAHRWRYDMSRGWVPPGHGTSKKGTQFTFHDGFDPTGDPKGFHLLASPPGTAAPIDLINYTPETKEVHQPGALSPVDKLNYTIVPPSRAMDMSRPPLPAASTPTTPGVGAGADGGMTDWNRSRLGTAPALASASPTASLPQSATPVPTPSMPVPGQTPRGPAARPPYMPGSATAVDWKGVGVGADGDDDEGDPFADGTDSTSPAAPDVGGPAQGPQPVPGHAGFSGQTFPDQQHMQDWDNGKLKASWTLKPSGNPSIPADWVKDPTPSAKSGAVTYEAPVVGADGSVTQKGSNGRVIQVHAAKAEKTTWGPERTRPDGSRYQVSSTGEVRNLGTAPRATKPGANWKTFTKEDGSVWQQDSTTGKLTLVDRPKSAQPITVGNSVIQWDGQQGKYVEVYKAPADWSLKADGEGNIIGVKSDTGETKVLYRDPTAQQSLDKGRLTNESLQIKNEADRRALIPHAEMRGNDIYVPGGAQADITDYNPTTGQTSKRTIGQLAPPSDAGTPDTGGLTDTGLGTATTPAPRDVPPSVADTTPPTTTPLAPPAGTPGVLATPQIGANEVLPPDAIESDPVFRNDQRHFGSGADTKKSVLGSNLQHDLGRDIPTYSRKKKKKQSFLGHDMGYYRPKIGAGAGEPVPPAMPAPPAMGAPGAAGGMPNLSPKVLELIKAILEESMGGSPEGGAAPGVRGSSGAPPAPPMGAPPEAPPMPPMPGMLGSGADDSAGELHPPINPAQVVGTGHKFGQPLESGEEIHKGVDLQAVKGTPVWAPVDGVVRIENNPDGLGLQVKIVGRDGKEHGLGHLASVAVKDGQTVRKGQNVGKVGNTGRSTGPHLDYRQQNPDGSFDNPEPQLGQLAQMPPAPGTQMMGSGADEEDDSVSEAAPEDQPAPADPPAPEDQPAPADQPAPTEQPAPADQPAPTGQPTPTNPGQTPPSSSGTSAADTAAANFAGNQWSAGPGGSVQSRTQQLIAGGMPADQAYGQAMREAGTAAAAGGRGRGAPSGPDQFGISASYQAYLQQQQQQAEWQHSIETSKLQQSVVAENNRHAEALQNLQLQAQSQADWRAVQSAIHAENNRHNMAQEDLQRQQQALDMKLETMKEQNSNRLAVMQSRMSILDSALKNPWLQKLTGLTPQSMTDSPTGGQNIQHLISQIFGGLSDNPNQSSDQTRQAQAAPDGSNAPDWQTWQQWSPFQKAAWRTNTEAAGPGAFEQAQAGSQMNWQTQGANPNVTQAAAATADQAGTAGMEMTADMFGQTPQNFWTNQQKKWGQAQAPSVKQTALGTSTPFAIA